MYIKQFEIHYINYLNKHKIEFIFAANEKEALKDLAIIQGFKQLIYIKEIQ